MHRLALPITVAFTLAMAASSLHARTSQAPALADVLNATATYLEQYGQAFTGLAADEASVQRSTIGGTPDTTRSVGSSVMLLSTGKGVWLGFRDATVADGHRIRDQKDRLRQLFEQAPDDALVQAQEMSIASARLNLSPTSRSFNVPTLALNLLSLQNQGQSTFTIEGTKTISGTKVIILHFIERGHPRVISTRDDAAVVGRAWVDADSGRVRQTEITLTSSGTDAKVVVTYGPQPNVPFWVPISMDEHYTGPNGGDVLGGIDVRGADSVAGAGTPSASVAHAGMDAVTKYTNYRAVAVDVSRIR